MSPGGARASLPARLYWRVYLNGLLLLALVAVALFGVGDVLVARTLPAPPILRGASFLSAVLLALALASIPLARAARGRARPRDVGTVQRPGCDAQLRSRTRAGFRSGTKNRS